MVNVHLNRRAARIERDPAIPAALVTAMTLIVLIAGAVISHLATQGWNHQVDFPPLEWSTNPPNWTD